MMKYYPLIIGCIAFVFALILIVNAPTLMIPGNLKLSSDDITQLHMDSRRSMAQLIASFVLLIGLLIAYKQISGLEKKVRLKQEAQTTERFSRAIDQLGTYKLEVQLGGIFALERIAWDSVKDHWTIVEILTAYVREHANCSAPNGKPQIVNSVTNGSMLNGKAPADIQAILTVLGRRRWSEDEKQQMKVLNLRRTNLSHLDLRRSYFEHANLRDSYLEQTNFSEAKLAGAFLAGVNLSGAILNKADLSGANLAGANLTNASLREANLTGANLKRANLKGACLSAARFEATDLMEADLRKANLSAAWLANANLANAKLNLVKYDYDTSFPDWLTEDLKEEVAMSFQLDS